MSYFKLCTLENEDDESDVSLKTCIMFEKKRIQI